MFSVKSAVIKRVLLVIYSVITIALMTLLIVLSLSPAYNVLYYFNPLTEINEAPYSINDSPQGTLSLPHTIAGLNPGDKVSVFLETSGNAQDNLLVEVDRAYFALFVDGEPYFSVGNEGTFPAFQKEPPRSIDIISLPNVPEGTEIRLDYIVSEAASSLNMQPFLSGDQNLITKQVIMENYPTLILSVMMLVMGVALALIGLTLFSRVELAITLFWLGLTCLASGSWTFFSSEIIMLFFSQFSAFYTISFISLYIIPIPLGRFCLSYLHPYRSSIFEYLFIVCCAFFALVMITHVTGVISFGEVEPYFKALAPLMLMVYLVILLIKRSKGEVAVSGLYIFGITLFAALALFDGLSGVMGIDSPVGTFFLVGLFFAAVVIALSVWEYFNDALDALEKTARLEADISAVNRSLDLQRKHFEDFTHNVEETRRIRHDLRHQLVALQGFISEHKHDEALEYIDTLSKSIPSISDMLICENVAVNSLAVHYQSLAEEEGILFDIKIAVPQVVGRIPDGDLSIIFGNLFENAIEACRHVDPEKRFIKIRSNVVSNRLTLIIDNSFDGELQVSGTDFYSRKRKGYGVGVASVRSVVSKYDGSMKYETESGVFKTSLYVKL